MKKHMIAVAVAATVAVPAIAQNVTVYGTVDINLQSHKESSTTGGVTRENSSSFSTSRIGFLATEDLGGGLKVFAELRDEFDAAAAPALSFDQENKVGLSGSFGTVQLGTTDVTPTQGLDGSVGQFGNFTNHPAAYYAGTTTAALTELAKDATNSITYASPAFSGFNVYVGHATGHTKSSTTDANAAQNSWTVTYANGPLFVGIGASEKDGSGVAATTQETIAASYDLGMAKIGVVNSVFDSSATTNANDTKVTIASVSVPMANGIVARAGYMMGKVDGEANNEAKGFVVGATKAMSKRTTVYAHYTKVTNEAAGLWGWAGTTQPGTAGNDPTALGIGISHSF